MKKLWISLAVFVAVCVAAGFWWDAGHGQAWLAGWTGTDNCPAPVTYACVHYGFWSGFGSVIPWALFSMGGIITGAWVGIRKVNCHEKGCPRVGRYPDAGGAFHYCGKHHPGWEGKHPSPAHRLEMHHLHHAAAVAQAQPPPTA
jgi:hypothetical protein